MCGFIAIVALDQRGTFATSAEVTQRLDDGLAQIKHRGPDARGKWISPDNRVGPRPQISPNVDQYIADTHSLSSRPFASSNQRSQSLRGSASA